MSRGGLSRFRFLPLILISLLAIAAAAVSVTESTPILSLSSISGLKTWPSSLALGVTCVSRTTCVVVGNGDGKGLPPTFAISESGGRWERAARISDGDVGPPNLIGCSTPGNCLGGNISALNAESHGRWSWGHVNPNPADALVQFAQMACSPSGLCWALGEFGFEGAHHNYFHVARAYGYRNGRWLPPNLLGPPRPPGSTRWVVWTSGISCWSRTSCTVVGENLSDSSKRTMGPAFLQSESNGHWGSPQWIPSGRIDGKSQRFLVDPFSSAISCVAVNTCMIVGFEPAAHSANQDDVAVAQVVGGIWRPTVLGFGKVSGINWPGISTVACHTANYCVISGVTGVGAGEVQSLVFRTERLGNWGPIVAAPSGLTINGYFSHPRAAACDDHSDCYVVGFYQTSMGQSESFIARSRGTTWTFQPVQLGRGEAQTLVQGISCASNNCWMVGTGFARNDTWSEGFAIPVVSLDLH